MLKWIHAIGARIKAMFAVDAALEIQSELVVRSAERKASLLRLAAQYEVEGLPSVASDLRQQAEALDLCQRFHGVVAAVEFPSVDDSMVLAADSSPQLANSNPPSSLPTGVNQSQPKASNRSKNRSN